jgi:hypothetical protein
MFRVYANADGSPAEYSENNVPFNQKTLLTSKFKWKKNDFCYDLDIQEEPTKTPASGIEQNVR